MDGSAVAEMDGAAFEAGVKALHADGCCACGVGECRFPDDIPDVEIDFVELILDAAAPHIRADAATQQRTGSRFATWWRQLFWQPPPPQPYSHAALVAAVAALHLYGCRGCQQGHCTIPSVAAEERVARLVLAAAAPHLRARFQQQAEASGRT